MQLIITVLTSPDEEARKSETENGKSKWPLVINNYEIKNFCEFLKLFLFKPLKKKYFFRSLPVYLLHMH